MSILTHVGDLDRSPGDPKVLRSGQGSLTAPVHLARALGWMSLALGAAEIVGGRRIAGALGMEERGGLVRAYGVREIASGLMTLAPGHMPGVASRIAGDVLDIATLMGARRAGNGRRGAIDSALAAVAAITVLDVICAGALQMAHGRKGAPRNYGDRSGFPKGAARARGVAASRSRAEELPA